MVDWRPNFVAWKNKARRLKACGYPIRSIASEVCRSYSVVLRAVNPETLEKYRAYHRRRAAIRYKEGKTK